MIFVWFPNKFRNSYDFTDDTLNNVKEMVIYTKVHTKMDWTGLYLTETLFFYLIQALFHNDSFIQMNHNYNQ